MSPFEPYLGEAYQDYPWLVAWCEALASARPDLVRLQSYGSSRHGKPLLLLTLALGAAPERRPGFWLDGGTHASEWTGVMATLYAVSQWVQRLDAGDPELEDYLRHHSIYVAPCLSPDGFEHLMTGGAFVRSTLRPPPEGMRRQGLEPTDIDADGEILWMRWYHPAGTWVQDEQMPMLPRLRRLEDDPASAFFMAPEGLFMAHDGAQWRLAEAAHSLDLNRNFPVHWSPFSQFGSDGGAFPMSEPEARAVVEAVHARPNICAAVTNHTYTGAILVAPYRQQTPLSGWDKETLWQLANEAVQGTGWRTMRVYPEFIYEEGKTIPGVWADHLVTNLGIPAYTLEIWDPFAHAGVTIDDPARNFARPEIAKIRETVAFFAKDPDTWRPWTPFDHPQLGPVEIGGFRQTQTIRNPPVAQLKAECEKAFTVADRIRRSLPRPRLTATSRPDSGLVRVEVLVENLGYLSTSSLEHGATAGFSHPPQVQIDLPDGARLVSGEATQSVAHLSGWGSAPSTFRRHPLFPTLPTRSQRLALSWLVSGEGEATVTYTHPRSGVCTAAVQLRPSGDHEHAPAGAAADPRTT